MRPLHLAVRSLVVPVALALFAPSAAAAPAQGASPNSDVTATRLIPLPAEALYNHLLDLRNHERIWSDECTKKWVHGDVSVGQGASAQLLYVPSVMRRKLTATLSRADEGRLIDIDHAGNKGFVMRWRLTPEGDGATRVDVHTYIQAPPKPFQRLYFDKVRPAWQLCHQQALATLERRLQP